MWLFIPLSSARALACSEKEREPDSSYSASNIEPFATWSGKPLLPHNLPALWKREPLIRRLSGLTCSPLTAQRGVDAWICSLRDSRARTSASPAKGLVLMESAPGSSLKSLTSLTIATRRDSFWRTSAPSLLPPPPLWTKPKASSSSARPPESWENWPIAGGTRNGSLFPRPTWVPRMGVHDGSALRGVNSWMTPSVSNSQGNEYTRDGGKPGQERLTLSGQTQQWPTPTASLVNDGEDPATWNARRKRTKERTGNGNGMGMPLTQAAQQWPTPASRDYRTPNSQESQESRNHKGGEQLPNFVEHHFSHPVHSTLDGRELSPTGRTLRRRLNPAFGCWLMGWPIWWTNPALINCVRSEMESYRFRLQSHLLSLCVEPGPEPMCFATDYESVEMAA